jgi:hypothetical protein
MEYHFSFRYDKLILLFICFAGLTYLLYWYLVPNLNYEIPAIYFVALYIVFVGFLIYDAHYKTTSISFVDMFDDCFVIKNIRKDPTTYYYKDIYDCILTVTHLNWNKVLRAELLYKDHTTCTLNLDNFSEKDVREMVTRISAKLVKENLPYIATKTFPVKDYSQIINIYLPKWRQYLLAFTILFIGLLLPLEFLFIMGMKYMSITFMILSSCIMGAMAVAAIYFFIKLIPPNRILQLEIGPIGIKFKDIPWRQPIAFSRTGNNTALPLFYWKKYRSLSFADIKSVRLIKSSFNGDCIVVYTLNDTIYLPLILKNRLEWEDVFNEINGRIKKREPDSDMR